MSTAPSDTTSATAAPTPSPIPVRSGGQAAEQHGSEEAERENIGSLLPQPKIRLEVRDLSHEGAVAFFKHVNPTQILTDSVTTVLQTLYFGIGGSRNWPPVRSITLVLRPMDGVAYTTGSELDDEHKEIHFSLDHIRNQEPQRQRSEIQGVLVHEMVHVWQWNGQGTCPGGLIEGIADYVRLRAGLAPPHWNRSGGGEWDAGYERTGYFLDWLDRQHGQGKIKELNRYLGEHRYYEETFWRDMFKKPIGELWEEYNRQFES